MSSRISAREALRKLRNGAVLIDVRSRKGRAANGELQGAVIVAKADILTFITRAGFAASDRQVVIFCGSIEGSGPVIEILHHHGVTQAVDVEGGFAALTGDDGLALVE